MAEPTRERSGGPFVRIAYSACMGDRSRPVGPPNPFDREVLRDWRDMAPCGGFWAAGSGQRLWGGGRRDPALVYLLVTVDHRGRREVLVGAVAARVRRELGDPMYGFGELVV